MSEKTKIDWCDSTINFWSASSSSTGLSFRMSKKPPMNIELLAADIASRVPSMAQDSPVNNVETIKGRIAIEIERCARNSKLESKSFSDARFELWSHMSSEHNLTLIDSELDDIIDLAVRVHQFAIRDEEDREKYLDL
jgi:hypothetical protein